MCELFDQYWPTAIVLVVGLATLFLLLHSVAAILWRFSNDPERQADLLRLLAYLHVLGKGVSALILLSIIILTMFCVGAINDPNSVIPN